MVISLEYNPVKEKEGFKRFSQYLLIQIDKELFDLIKDEGTKLIIKSTIALKKYNLPLEYLQKAKVYGKDVFVIDSGKSISWILSEKK